MEYGNIDEPRWRAFYERISPVNRAERIRVPVLYAHSANDRGVDKSESEAMVRAVRKNDVPVQYILFDDEGHGWRNPKNRLWYYPREAAFIEEHLGR